VEQQHGRARDQASFGAEKDPAGYSPSSEAILKILDCLGLPSRPSPLSAKEVHPKGRWEFF
jgi:hypothetical protein